MAYRKKTTSRKAAPKRSMKRKAAPKRKTATGRARASSGTTTIRIEMVHPAGAPSVASPMVPKVQSVKRARF